MKSKWVAWLIALMLCVPGAYAKGTGSSSHSASPSGFSRGFSGAKSSGSGGNKAIASSSKGSFGSFSATKPSPSPSPSAAGSPDTTSGKSALSSGLDKNAAQANAMKTWDERKGDKAASPTSTSMPAPIPVNSPPTYAPTQTIVVRDSGSSFGSNMLWFMLGRSMSDHHNYGAPYSGASGQYQSDAPGQATATPHESFGWSVLRIFLWLAFLSAIGWAIWFFVRKKSELAARRHYTL